MPYSEELADRIRRQLANRKALSERKMFGGIAFMLRGHMCCGVVKDDLMVRVDSGRYRALLKRPHTRVMDFTGRPMKGFVFVGGRGCADDDALRFWLDEAVQCALAKPAKVTKVSA